jgi:ribosome-associated translation inhibitor RaiA
MDVSIRSRHLDLSEPLKEYALRRLRFSVGAFAAHISGVDVRVEDVNGPRGGIDKKCVVAVLLRPFGHAFARSIDSDAYSAIDRAATRIRSVLVRTLTRRRASRRRDAAPAVRRRRRDRSRHRFSITN